MFGGNNTIISEVIMISIHILRSVYHSKVSNRPCDWAAPFKIHTAPVEDFGKVHRIGSVNFQMHPPCEEILYYSSQRE